MGRDGWLQGRVAACPDSMTVHSAARVSGSEASRLGFQRLLGVSILIPVKTARNRQS